MKCERIFKADLRDVPVVVVGNNDGCIVARSYEARALGIKMGSPLFECRKLIEQHSIAVFSSNYALYQDMSDRTMRLLARFTKHQEVYSIDEAWLDLSHVSVSDLSGYCQQIRAIVARHIGLPVSIGIGSTKVLAKIACELVKRLPPTQATGVCNLLTRSESDVDRLLETIAVGDVWGIGRQWASRLSRQGIVTAKDLKEADHIWIRSLLGVVGQRIVLELRGISCIPLETVPKPKQGIMTALSFGRPITERGRRIGRGSINVCGSLC